MGEDEQAYRALYHAHQLNPKEENTSTLLLKEALLLATKARARKEFEQSMVYLNCALHLRPDDAGVHQMMSDLYRSMGRRREADAELEIARRLLKANPTH